MWDVVTKTLVLCVCIKQGKCKYIGVSNYQPGLLKVTDLLQRYTTFSYI
jgi:diketogulonate reductase-like aldo/keto reductase